jgi:hypothetical protein
MQIFQSMKRQQLALALFAFALTWFAAGSTVNTLVASMSGKRVEIVLCTGTGVKKASMPLHDAGTPESKSASTLKHCSNAPLCMVAALPGTPVHLSFKPPLTVAVWQWIPSTHVPHHLIQDNKPPPGRAPPLALSA